jgi:DNA repair protein RecN (Recombination protein N)
MLAPRAAIGRPVRERLFAGSVRGRRYTRGVLLELRIENLLLIERAELRPEAGLNAITGETGAGKTVLAHALNLLLGGKPRSGIVRPGAEEAYVEGVFELPPGLLDGDALADLRERVEGGEEGEIVLARRVSAEGRTRAYVQGRSATAADLRELGGRLVSFFGQHEHRKLTVASAQLDLLDGFCGDAHLALRGEVAAAHARVRGLRGELDELRDRAGTRDRDLDLLRFELAEIDAVGPTVEEHDALTAERGRLREVDGLRAAAAAGAEALAPADGDGGAAQMVAEAERLAGAVDGADPELDALAERLRGLRLEAEDLGGELRRYLETIDADPQRLEQAEARLSEYDRLTRKHGGTVEAVLAHAERCREQRDRLENAEVAVERAEAELAAAEAERAELAARLTAGRRRAAPKLAKAVVAELAALAMDGASFEVLLQPREEVGATGAERVELMLAPNPGVPAAPVRESASGGELSRVMLALMAVAGTGGAGVLVFDEVDSGVGGQTARAVGERLRALGSGRQVLCITHLPQIAALADRHFRIEKSPAGDVARTSVERLDDGAVVEELCRMLGADASDAGARRHAQELRTSAAVLAGPRSR